MKVQPVKNYKTPAYPNKAQAELDPNLLRKLPSRWANNAAVVTALVTLSSISLAACSMDPQRANEPEMEEYTGSVVMDKVNKEENQKENQNLEKDSNKKDEKLSENKTDQNKTTKNEQKEPTLKGPFIKAAPLFTHGDGTGTLGCLSVAPPVFFTEQEAYAIIKDEMKDAGLNLTKTYPVVTIEPHTGNSKDETIGRAITLEGYDPNKKVGITFVSNEDGEILHNDYSSSVSSYDMKQRAKDATEDFAKKQGDFTVGVFYDPSVNFVDEQEKFLKEINLSESDFDKLSYTKRKEYYNTIQSRAMKEAEEELRTQVQDFLKWLTAQGII